MHRRARNALASFSSRSRRPGFGRALLGVRGGGWSALSVALRGNREERRTRAHRGHQHPTEVAAAELVHASRGLCGGELGTDDGVDVGRAGRCGIATRDQAPARGQIATGHRGAARASCTAASQIAFRPGVQACVPNLHRPNANPERYLVVVSGERLLPATMISTRRLLARPSGVSLLATGLASPLPTAVIFSDGTPRLTR